MINGVEKKRKEDEKKKRLAKKMKINSTPNRIRSKTVQNIRKITREDSIINTNKNRNKINLKQKNLLKKPINYNDKNPNLTTNKKVNSNKEKKLSLEEYEFKIPEKYKNNKYKLAKTLKAGDKIINIYNDNKKEIIFQSGVRKEIFKDGFQIIYFVNGDIKQNYPNGKSIYYFSQAKTVQTTYKNGIIVVKFDNNQVERHYPDGKKQILFPDGSEKTIYNNGNDKSIYSEENSINNE
jgi:centromere protein J